MLQGITPRGVWGPHPSQKPIHPITNLIMAGWLAGGPAGSWAGWLAGELVGWLAGGMVGWMDCVIFEHETIGLSKSLFSRAHEYNSCPALGQE